MGKNKSVSTVLLAFVTVFSLNFYGCDNLFERSSLKENLDTAVEYANAASYTVRVQAAEGTGTITAGSGDNTLKVTDKLKISFSKASGYKFIKWHAFLKSDETVSSEDYVTFEDASALETTATIVQGAEDIVIEPLCEKTLSLTAAYPVSSDEGVARDSTIKLVFSNPLSADNDLSKISISISGSGTDGKNYFGTPKLADNQLIITANTENRIYVGENETKTVTVTIPADFTYVTNSGNLEIGEEISHSYVINSSTSDKTFITYGTEDENAGTIKINGIAAPAVSQQYNIGQSVTVTFKVADGYRFNGWDCSDEGSILLTYPADEEYDENGYNSATSTATVYIQIINSSENVMIRALAEKIPTADILVTTTYGKISPNGTKNYIEGKGGTLIFNADADYQFIKWQVINSSSETNEDLTDQGYIEFTKPEEFNTDFTLVKAPAADSGIVLSIQPLCQIRPQILSTSPLYSAGGVYRDTRIQVMFDQKINEDAIYFTDAEVSSLEASGNTMIKPTVDDNTTKYYGYKGTDGYVYFKNISIINASTKESLLTCYNAPYFDELSNLIIPAKTGDEAPNSGITIIVELSKNLYYTTSGNNIQLSESKKWNYRVNSLTDSTGPDFEDCHLFRNSDLTELTADDTFTLDQTNLRKDYLSDNKYQLYVKFNDSVSGPKKLTVAKRRIYDEYYNSVSETAVALDSQKTVIDVEDTVAYYGSFNKSDGKYSKSSGGYYNPNTIDLSESEDGVYEISIIASDLCGNTTTKKYYVVKDTEANTIKNLSATGGDTKITLNWTNAADIDASTVTVNDEAFDTTEAEAEVEKEITGLSNGTTYSYVIKARDIFEHEYTSETIKRSTIPNAPVYNENVIDDNAATLYWTNPDGNRTHTIIKCTTTGDTSTTTASNFQVTDMKHGSLYSFTLCNYFTDEDGTELYSAETSEITLRTRPAPVTSPGAKGGDRQIILNWTNPTEGDYSGVKIYYKGSTDSDYTVYDSVAKGTNSKTISALTNGTTYNFKLAVYDTDENECKTPAEVSKSTIPNYISSDTVTATTDSTTLTLNWTNPDGNYTGTKIYVSKNEITSTTGLTPVDTTETSCSFTEESDGTAFVKGKKYYFRLYGYYTDESETLLSSGYATKNRNTIPNDVVIKAELSSKTPTGSKTIKYSWEAPEGNFTGVHLVVDDDYSDSTSLAVNVEENILGSVALEKSVTFNSYSLETTAKIYAYDDEDNHSNITSVIQCTGIASPENLTISGKTMTFEFSDSETPASIKITSIATTSTGGTKKGASTTTIYNGDLTSGTHDNLTFSIASSSLTTKKVTITRTSDFPSSYKYTVIVYSGQTDSNASTSVLH